MLWLVNFKLNIKIKIHNIAFVVCKILIFKMIHKNSCHINVVG